MELTDAGKYCNLMLESKFRLDAVNRILTGSITLGYMPINVETIFLQYRKVLELIALGSLVANKKMYCEVRDKFAQDWHAERVFKVLEKLNPHFYPEPVKHHPPEQPGLIADLRKFDDNFLTRDDFAVLYNLCGDLLHSENPYGKEKNYMDFKEQALSWGIKIRNLLGTHRVQLVDDKRFYLIQMGGEQQEPSYTLFELLE